MGVIMKNNIMRIDFEETGIKKTALYNGNVTTEEFARDIIKGGLYSDEVVTMDRKQFETIFADLILDNKKHTDLLQAGLSISTYNCLKRQGINCLEDLEGYTIDDFRQLKYFPQRRFNEVYNACKRYGIKINVGRRTNADDVRVLSIEELADMIMCPYNKSSDLDCDNKNCHDCCVEWLNQDQEGNHESK